MSTLVNIGWIPVQPVGRVNGELYAGEHCPTMIRTSKYACARWWVIHQRWSPVQLAKFWALDTQDEAVAWVEALGVQFLPVHMGDLSGETQ